MTMSYTTRSQLLREDWDFSKVPEDELDACFTTECARDWEGTPSALVQVKKISDIVTEQPEISLSKVRVPVVTNRGGNILQNATNVRQVASLVHFDDWPGRPWQLLTNTDRLYARQFHAAGLSQIVDPVDFPPDGFSYGSHNFVAFKIDWRATDKYLQASFADWLRVHRQVQAIESRGSNRRDHLKMLGAMRLLHHYSYDDAFALSKESLGRPLYGKRPSWERARKGALVVYLNTFFVDWKAFQVIPFPRSFPKLGQSWPVERESLS